MNQGELWGNNSPSLVGVGYVRGQTQPPSLLFIPGSCDELLRNSGGGDCGLHQSCLQWPPQTVPTASPEEGASRGNQCQKLCRQSHRTRRLTAERSLGLALVPALPPPSECPQTSQEEISRGTLRSRPALPTKPSGPINYSDVWV